MADFSLGVAELGTSINLEGLEKGLSDAESTTKQRAGGIGGFFGQAFAFATGGLIQKGIETLTGTVSDFFSGMIGDAREANQVMAQTEAVIKSTGGAAGFSAQQIADMASSLSAASGRSLFDDADIQRGSNLLLTFTNIKDTLPDATKTLVDMAAAMGTDVKSSAIQLGKALNDPIAGISALSRVGVTFDAKQKAVIERLTKTGDVAGAQRIILAELNKEFGGSAQAAADADGGMAQFNARMGEAKEAIGTAVLPLLNELAGLLNSTVAPAIEGAAQVFTDLVGDFQSGGLGVVIDDIREMTGIDLGPLVGTFQEVASAAQGLYDIFFNSDFTGGIFGLQEDDPIIGTLFDIRDAAADLIATFTDAGPVSLEFAESIGQISPVLGGVLQVAAEVLPSLEALVSQVLGDIVAYFQANGAQMLGDAQATWTSISETISAIANAIGPVINAVLAQISAFWQAHGQEILAFVEETWTQINSIIQIAMQLIQATVVPALQFLAQFISDHGAEIQAAFSGAWQIISSTIDAALTLIKGILSAALQAIHGDWSGAWQTIQDMSARFVTDILGVINGGLQLIKALFDTTIDLILGIWNGLIGKSAGIGNDIVNGVINGIKGAADRLFSTLKGIAENALQAAKDAIHIGSPSLDFAEQVGAPIIDGIVAGLTGTANSFYNALSDVATNGVGIMADAADGLGRALQGSDAPDDANDLGTAIMEGLVQGMEDHLSHALDTMQNAADQMLGTMQDALGIHSPSEMFADIGQMSILGWLQGMQDRVPDLLDAMSLIGDDMLKKAQAIADGVADALQSAFGSEADIDRQKARNIKALEDVGAAAIDMGNGISEQLRPEQHQRLIKQQLDAAEQAAAAMNDPEQAAKFYKMRSSQIMELAKLQSDLAAADSDAERNRLREQIQLISAAQEAERKAFAAGQAKSGSGGLGRLAKQIQDFLNDKNTPGLLDDPTGTLQQLFDLLGHLLDSTSTPGMPGAAGQSAAGAGFLSGLPVQTLAAAGIGQRTIVNNIYQIDARGATMSRAEYEAITRKAIDEASQRADVLQRTRR